MERSHWQGIWHRQSSSQLNGRSGASARRYDKRNMAGVPASIRVKVTRANHHIADLNPAIDVFLKSGPYKTTGDIDSQGRPTYRVSNVQPVDPVILAIAGDAIQNLRTALDYLACALWLRTNPGGICKVYFPITETAARYNSEGLGKIKGMGQDAVDAISAVEPYGGGEGDTLWRLHCMSIIDKHRLSIAAVGANAGIHLPSLYPELFPASAKSNPWIVNVSDMRFSLKDDDVLFRDDPGRELKKDLNFPFFIALNEAGVFERIPLISALLRMRDSVNGVVADLDSLFV